MLIKKKPNLITFNNKRINLNNKSKNLIFIKFNTKNKI